MRARAVPCQPLGIGEAPLPVSDLQAASDAKIADREHVWASEIEDEEHLDEEVRRGRRVLVRVGGVRVEEPAAVGAQVLDRYL